MRYFIFVDRSDPMPPISYLSGDAHETTVIYVGVPGDRRFPDVSAKILKLPSIESGIVQKLDIKTEDRVVICAQNPEKFLPILEILGCGDRTPPVLILTSSPLKVSTAALPNVSIVSAQSIVRENISEEWVQLDIRRKAYTLWQLLRNKKKILIMTQNDPDPDAIASGLAIQALIDGDSRTAPICTLGDVTRNENIAMLQLLKTGVRRISENDIPGFDAIVMVDVQPGYFKEGLFKKVDAVIDHHPYKRDYNADFIGVDSSYGATSTMMAEYLAAGGIRISEKLATALLYGVITDTMLLARDSSSKDFKAFSMLWPMANHQLLASMSRPRLAPDELSYFVRAIENRKVVGEFLYIWLGSVKKEDIIPRLADFSLQIGDNTISAVCGVYQGNIVISLRNMESDCDVGKLASEIFSKSGSAGGHHSMAKAVMPLKEFKKAYKIRTLKQLDATLLNLISDYIISRYPVR